MILLRCYICDRLGEESTWARFGGAMLTAAVASTQAHRLCLVLSGLGIVAYLISAAMPATKPPTEK